MKYNFMEPINKHIDVKINGSLKAKSWLQGVPQAAQGCERLAIWMALEVYIRASIETSSAITLESAIRVLSGIGFEKQAITEEARSGYFSVFFIFRDKA